MMTARPSEIGNPINLPEVPFCPGQKCPHRITVCHVNGLVDNLCWMLGSSLVSSFLATGVVDVA